MHQTTIVIGVEKAVSTLKSTPIHPLDDSSDSKQCDQTQLNINSVAEICWPPLTLLT